MRLFLLTLLFACANLAFGTPDVDAILRKLGANAADPSQTNIRNSFAYDRNSRLVYLDDDDAKMKEVTRVYRVSPENGQPITKLISVNGRPATEKDQQKQSSARQTGDKSRSLALSEDLLSRYHFTYTGQDTVNGRAAWILRFMPRNDLDSDGFFDKLVNAMQGIIWVDVEEGQLAKAEIFLSKKVSFFGGFAGAIERLDLTLVQRRLEPNVWLSEGTFIDFSGRKLFSSVRFRCYETCSGFVKLLQNSVLP